MEFRSQESEDRIATAWVPGAGTGKTMLAAILICDSESSPQYCSLVGQTSEVLAKFGSRTAPSRSRLGKWIPFNVEFPSPAQRAPHKQAVSSNSASSSSVCGGLQPASARPEISQSSQTGGVSSA